MIVTVEVNDLRIYAFHGVLEQERKVGNNFEVTVHVRCRIMDQAMADDSIEDTINYADIVGIIKQVMSRPSSLIENVAWRIMNELRTAFPQIIGGYLRIAKLKPPIPSSSLGSTAVTLDW